MCVSIRSVLKILAPVIALIIGATGMWALSAQRQPPAKNHVQASGTPVEVVSAERTDHQVIITGHGSVQARYEISLEPQVSGRVVWAHPDLAPGAVFEKGEPLVEIDRTDFELAVRQAEATLAQAQVAEEKEKALAEIAQAEWKSVYERALGRDALPEEPNPLVLHKPQLREAAANVASAEAALDLRRLDLERTTIRAPFNCRVRRQSVSVGKLVAPGSVIAEIFDTDRIEVEVGLPQADLASFDIPGAPARISLDLGGQHHHWRGTVVRQVGVLDDVGRLARVVIELEAERTNPEVRRPLLSLGSFVAVEIEGRTMEDVIAISRSLLRRDDTVWVADDEGRLEIRRVTVARLTERTAVIESGLAPGDRIVMTNLRGAAQGMLLLPQEDGDPT